MKAAGAGQCADFIGRKIGELLVTIGDFEVFELLLELIGMAALGGKVQIARAQFTIDLIFFNQVADALHRVEAQLP